MTWLIRLTCIWFMVWPAAMNEMQKKYSQTKGLYHSAYSGLHWITRRVSAEESVILKLKHTPSTSKRVTTWGTHIPQPTVWRIHTTKKCILFIYNAFMHYNRNITTSACNFWDGFVSCFCFTYFFKRRLITLESICDCIFSYDFWYLSDLP